MIHQSQMKHTHTHLYTVVHLSFQIHLIVCPTKTCDAMYRIAWFHSNCPLHRRTANANWLIHTAVACSANNTACADLSNQARQQTGIDSVKFDGIGCVVCYSHFKWAKPNAKITYAKLLSTYVHIHIGIRSSYTEWPTKFTYHWNVLFCAMQYLSSLRMRRVAMVKHAEWWKMHHVSFGFCFLHISKGR